MAYRDELPCKSGFFSERLDHCDLSKHSVGSVATTVACVAARPGESLVMRVDGEHTETAWNPGI